MPEPRGILITRPEPGASETSRQIAALGWVPVVAPMLRVRPLPASVPTTVEAVLISSGNGVPGLPAALHGLPLLAVGDATAARARSAGFTQACSAAGDAAALAALAERVLPPGACVLLATGAGQGRALAADLRGRGFRVHRRAVYAARPVGRLPRQALDALAGHSLHAGLFLSAETAHAFVRAMPVALHPALAGVDAVAIGQLAADALMRLPWRRVRVSAKPRLESVMALL